MTDSGVARTVRQRGAVMAGAGYGIQFLAIIVLLGFRAPQIATLILVILEALLVRSSFRTYNDGLQKSHEFDRRSRFRRLQGLAVAVYVVAAIVAGALGPTVLYLLGAAISFLGNETLVSGAKAREF